MYASLFNRRKKNEIFTEYGGSATNTGSIEGQIALFTFRIKSLSDHLKTNKHDNSCKRTLLSLVGKRKRVLKYLQDRDIQKYRSLIDKLGIRK
ncbi:MAG: 30S ribosomal protein S15 [Saprospiraceae bacterium]|nr:30S ribosomal protein S15 [Saprospiraceae bacterium]